VYTDTSTLHRSDDPSVVIPIEKDDSAKFEALSGKYRPHIFSLFEATEAVISEVDNEDGGCFLKIGTKLKSGR
jgi:hypothetical protein